MRQLYLFFYAIISCMLLSCTYLGMSEKEDEGKLSLRRFDRVLCGYGLSGSFTDLKAMDTEFASEKRILVENVLKIGTVTDDDIDSKLYDVLSDTSMVVLMTDCVEMFKDMSDVEISLDRYFRKMGKLLPDARIPHVYTQFSGMRESVVVKDSLVGISLDKYMGDEYPPYAKYFSESERMSMNPSRIETDCVFFYLLSLSDRDSSSGLERMIAIGKAAYMTCLITGKNVYEIFSMTEENRKWLASNREALLGLLAVSADELEKSQLMLEAESREYQVIPVLAYSVVSSAAEESGISCTDLLAMDSGSIIDTIGKND